mmetsp:Transcript_91688/g.296644  ORF Transcript_91688/g.296644 Transcript_91688/m.296644 type:complete len:207 (-) Transcript_91688:388-1008(-)
MRTPCPRSGSTSPAWAPTKRCARRRCPWSSRRSPPLPGRGILFPPACSTKLAFPETSPPPNWRSRRCSHTERSRPKAAAAAAEPWAADKAWGLARAAQRLWRPGPTTSEVCPPSRRRLRGSGRRSMRSRRPGCRSTRPSGRGTTRTLNWPTLVCNHSQSTHSTLDGSLSSVELLRRRPRRPPMTTQQPPQQNRRACPNCTSSRSRH